MFLAVDFASQNLTFVTKRCMGLVRRYAPPSPQALLIPGTPARQETAEQENKKAHP